MGSRIQAQEDRRQEAYEVSRKLNALLVQTQLNIQQADYDTSLVADFVASHTLLQLDNRQPREANLSHRMQDVVNLYAYAHFLKTGSVLELSESIQSQFTDEEFLAGACMGLAHDLERYALGRATMRDIESIKAARTVVSRLFEYLLQFDFRNGPLRRKYDGVKYALKNIETFLYELAITSPAGEPDNKKVKVDEPPLLQQEAWQALKARMEHRDELRERLIKKSRDGQKAAKQAIFALQRGDVKRAQTLLNECQVCIQEHLWPIVQEEPPLRYGSFAGVLEEYVEAKLFMAWLYGKEGDVKESPATTLLALSDFAEYVEPEDYIGGLCDLTGEVGRYAVQRGTSRDVASVQLCWQTTTHIYTHLQQLERLPQGVGKKLDGLRRSVDKLERMMYEMSLSEAAGGRQVRTDVEAMVEEKEGENITEMA
jgi:predicted translin family RNA/ssDNA-binding protein